jgi:hypothetical protein
VLISTELRCVFVHVQKTGGVSVERALLALDPSARTRFDADRHGRHAPARELRTLLSPGEWDAAFKFAIVRNPFSRLVSWYHHCVQRPENRFHHDVAAKCPEFRDFVLRRDFYGWRRTERNQVDYVSDEAGDRIVDAVGRFESLAADFEDIYRRIRERHPDPARLPATHGLPHTNRSSHRDHRGYYDDATRAVVEERFARDLAAFGYAF